MLIVEKNFLRWDFTHLVNLSNLTTLFLRNNQLQDIDQLYYIDSLQNLDLHGNNITDLPMLPNLI